MEVKAIAKNVGVSPRKLRLLARVFSKTKALETLIRLQHVDRAGSIPLAKVIASAVTNAQRVHQLPADNLEIKTILIDSGVVYKRFRPTSRGSAHTYKKRNSHITVILEG
jgi:large subunit ribosomal protein L22